jgi:exodeoxyribonuclease V alpha subunit
MAFASFEAGPIPGDGWLPKATTLHRLLGYMPSTGRFRYDADHPLPVDGVIVDEASMVDMGLMARLMAAMPPRARLILVGDKDQLSSVEAGAVLGDICFGISNFLPGTRSSPSNGEPGGNPPALQRRIVVLTQNYRFGSQSGIAALCQAINQGDSKKCLSLLSNTDYPDIALRPLYNWRDLKSMLTLEIITQIAPMFKMPSAAEALKHFGRFRFLAALRKGSFGVPAINALIEEVLKRHGLILGEPGQWYPFRPLMITSNDYLNELFNGDVGMVQRADDDPQKIVQVVFEDGKGGFRHLSPHQLPPHETVFAMTVHKSQGSEFDNVFLILPHRDAPVLTRELIYTAVTRARKSVTIWGDPDLLANAIQRRIQRASGLREALWG